VPGRPRTALRATGRAYGSAMRIAVLGPLEVRRDTGEPVAVPGAKERLLLAALAAGAPGAVSTDSLVETLWDGDAPPSARKSLQAHVVRLRSSLEPDRPKGSTGRYVVRRGTGYALTLDRASIDRLAIGDLAARGHARLASGEPAEAERQLGAAADLWRGTPYADWPDADFAAGERARLEEIHAGAVAGVLESRLQLGRHAEVLPELERLVAAHPLREDWWRLLVLALYRAGRQADALAAVRGSGRCSPTSSARVPVLRYGRWKPPSWPRTRRWRYRCSHHRS
jgi:DNA-binding SARP family transcriptional activator